MVGLFVMFEQKFLERSFLGLTSSIAWFLPPSLAGFSYFSGSRMPYSYKMSAELWGSVSGKTRSSERKSLFFLGAFAFIEGNVFRSPPAVSSVG